MQLAPFDTFRLFNAIAATAAIFGFTNIDDACFQGGPLGLGGGLACRSTPSSYLFWDGVHPDDTAHRCWAQRSPTPCSLTRFPNRRRWPSPASALPACWCAAARRLTCSRRAA